jgi:hypothetical protein
MSVRRSKAIGLLLFLISTSRIFANSISVVGPANNPKVGDTLSVNISVTGIIDLYAFQFDVLFNPTLLAAISVSEGPFLPSGGTTIFIPGTIDTAGGTISATADTLVAAVPGVTGSGVLAAFQFTALAAGTSALSFANETLLDSGLNDITANTTFLNGSVTITAPSSSTPEPATLAMMLCAFAILVVVWHRGSRKETRHCLLLSQD